ncbi:hypothetical protein FQN49_004448 [Arthroderma sp. PD_2]|nr:hypothetical protein FQN49_004448 [Arthroderma sp. PD_2]
MHNAAARKALWRSSLSTDVPNDLLRTKGVADEQLNRTREERSRLSPSRSPERDLPGATRGSRKRARSISSCSSVSTISTSRSLSPPSRAQQGRSLSRSDDRSPARTAGSRINRPEPESDSSSDPTKDRWSRDRDHHTSRHQQSRRSHSPEPNRRRGRSREDVSYKSKSAHRRRDRSVSEEDHRHDLPDSRDRAPHSRNRPGIENHSSQQRSPPRQRSLSPYSKRIALTQAMNTSGR